jgi:hypothetical protein
MSDTAAEPMNERLVACVRWCPPEDPDETAEQRDQGWVNLGPPLFDRAVALGGRVVAWGYETLTVDFAWDGLYDAVDFLVDAPLAPELASGLALGAVQTISEHAQLALATGPGIKTAALLADLARPGEVLLSPEILVRSDHAVGSLGDPGKRPGRPQLPAVILDPARPLRSAPSSPPGRLTTLPPLSQSSTPAPDSALASFQRSAAKLGSDSTFPEQVGDALQRRDSESLLMLAAEVQKANAPDLAARLEAMASLANGKSGESIRKFRAAKEASRALGGSSYCRAAVALGVALAAAGRPHDGVLEALDGLARARECGDQRGERACAGLLSQIARALGDDTSAQSWYTLAHAELP